MNKKSCEDLLGVAGDFSMFMLTQKSKIFNGQVEEVKIFNYALTSTQVKDLYKQSLPFSNEKRKQSLRLESLNNGAVNFAPSTGAP